MKILFVVRTLGYGGASKQLRLTAEALAEKGNEVWIYTYNDNHTKQTLLNAHFLPEKKPATNKLAEYIYSPLRIRRTIKKISPQVVVSWRANAGCFTTLACKGLRVRHIFSERTDPYWETSKALKIATKLCDMADFGVFQTEGAQRYYKRLSRGKSTVIPNPIILEGIQKFVPYENRKNELVWVGRMVMSQKRMDVMLKAFRIVRDKNKEVRLVFYGDGVDLDKAKSISNRLGLDDNVVFAGAKKEIPMLIKDAKAFVLSSDYEGIPNTVMEAMALGVPVVATDTSPGGTRLLIEDGVNGFLCPCGNSEALAEKILFLLENTDTAKRFIEESRKRIEMFAPDKIFGKWQKCVNEIINY